MKSFDHDMYFLGKTCKRKHIYANTSYSLRYIRGRSCVECYKLKKEDFLDDINIIQLGYPPNRINILMSTEGVTFDRCYLNKETILLENIPVYYICLDDLITIKKTVGRPRDLADVDYLT